MAEFRDGSLRAEMATADMRLPIQLAMAWPERLATGVEPVPLTERPLTSSPSTERRSRRSTWRTAWVAWD